MFTVSSQPQSSKFQTCTFQFVYNNMTSQVLPTPKVPCLSNCPDDFSIQPCTLNQCKWSIFPVKELLWENCEREKWQKWNPDEGTEVRRDLWGLVSSLRTDAADARLCMKKAFSFTFLLCTLLAGEMCRAVLILKWQMCQYKTKLWQVQSFLSAWFTSHLHLSLHETEEQTDKKTSLNVWKYICCNRREDKR